MSLLEVNNLKVYYASKKGLLNQTKIYNKAVDNISFTIEKGESLGLVGESGSGKSTTGKAIIGLLKITGGRILYDQKDITQYVHKNKSNYRKEVQMIFQDAYSSLNPRKSIRAIIAEPLMNFYHMTESEIDTKIIELLSIVGMGADAARKYPHQFSGGQRQRICIARALALHPKLIVADEPVSALDLSVQAQVLNYMKKIQKEFSLSYLFISHDLSVIKHMCDRIAIMHKGRFVEIGTTKDIFENPQHIYTKRLLAAIPVLDPNERISMEEKRQDIFDTYQKDQHHYYDENGEVFDIKAISSTHFVALSN